MKIKKIRTHREANSLVACLSLFDEKQASLLPANRGASAARSREKSARVNELATLDLIQVKLSFLPNLSIIHIYLLIFFKCQCEPSSTEVKVGYQYRI